MRQIPLDRRLGMPYIVWDAKHLIESSSAMANAAAISQKLEDYLEAIFHLMAEKRVARVRDIARSMGVRMPTVTGALKHLAEHGLVNYEPYQYVTLTPEGVKIAREMVRRHDVLKKFIAEVLTLPEDIAEHDACGMEHALSDETLARLIQFLRFMAECPRAGSGLVESFRCSCGDERDGKKDCERCITSCLVQLRRKASGNNGRESSAPDKKGSDARSAAQEKLDEALHL